MQEAAIPAILDGSDILVKSQTGSGIFQSLHSFCKALYCHLSSPKTRKGNLSFSTKYHVNVLVINLCSLQAKP